MLLTDFPPLKFGLATPKPCDSISGSIENASQDVVVFTGLFRRAIPAGCPSACTLVLNGSDYVLRMPADGIWNVLSVAVPWTADGLQLLTLKDLARGRSTPILVQDGRWYGNGRITLSMPSPLDPPILTAVPLQIGRYGALLSDAPASDSWRERPATISESC
jgi:hypothetical protein